ncbi:MAG: hypothetical protein EB127_21485 [Alphaproteobacteria bacterium]|nr:hypothetical protein [Alphaproteobacteria bacterium]
MQITKMVATEVATPTVAGSASSISQATCVRLHNNTGGIATVGISTLVGAATTIFFSMPANSVEFLTKLPSDVIYTTPAIKAAKVGFTN